MRPKNYSVALRRGAENLKGQLLGMLLSGNIGVLISDSVEPGELALPSPPSPPQWGSGALGGAGPFPLHHHRLLASKDGTGPADGRHTQIRAVLVLSDHVSDAAEGSPSILVDGGPHIRSGRFSLTGSAFHNYHDPFAIGGRLHSDGLAVN